ncbi:MAG TPA: DUF5009 domain-containing protein [Verrucomicrobiota bacterium]|nr:DUF5009 domain-containing protein [Verrucomicrobiota bacterium]
MQPSPSESPTRLTSIDAYRGFVMILMASGGFGIAQVARHYNESGFWQFLARQTEHVPWAGCSLWDLIQPSFMFLVGVALPFSIANRQARGQSFAVMLGHAIWRAVALVFLGIFLRSVGRKMTYFTFEDVLTQIGLGYVFLFLLGWTKARTQAIAAGLILFGYWLAFALYPLPPNGFDWSQVGVPADWPHHPTGFAAHWDKNTNLAAAFDQWFLNLFPREQRFVYNGGGYLTLNFVPSLATMIFGLLAGGLLRSAQPKEVKVKVLVGAGVVGLVVGWLLGWLGICPVVKRIWTPSWAIYAGGWTCLLLGAFYWSIDNRGWRRWAFPLVVVGMNSIMMYCMANLTRGFFADSLKTHFGQQFFQILGAPFEGMVRSVVLLIIWWLVLFWMYRRRIFLRI